MGHVARAGCKMWENGFEAQQCQVLYISVCSLPRVSLTKTPQKDEEVCFLREWIFFFKCNASFIILKSNLLRPQCCPSTNPKRNKLRETPAQPYKNQNVEQNQMAGL